MLDVLFEDDRAVGVTIREEDGTLREVRAKVVVDASGQAGLIQNRLRLRVWDPVLNKGAIWTYWEGAYRDTGRDEGATMVLQTADKNGWFWYIPLHNNIVSVGVVAPFDYLFKNRGSYEQTYEEEVERCPAVKERVALGDARHRLLRDQGLLVSRHAGRRRRLGAGRRRVGLPRSALFVRRAAGAQVGRAGRRRDRRGVEERRHVGGAARQVGARLQRTASIACGGWSASTTTASASASSCASIPTCEGTVTDLLIGDLFTDRVDKVWAADGVAYPPGKAPIPPWNAGTPQDAGAGKGERALAAGRDESPE